MKRCRTLLFWCLLALAALLGCHHASDELAKLDTKQGTVDRDLAKQQGACP